MSFGADLKDQVRTINSYLRDGVSFFNELRDFVRERAQIEREYSQKLEGLVRKYSAKKNKRAGRTEEKREPDEDEWDWDDNESTTFKAWSSLLSETENISKAHTKHSDLLLSNVAEQLKKEAAKKDESRKKHMNFYSKLQQDRDRLYAEKDTAKKHYDEICETVETLKTRVNNSNGDAKSMEKLSKQYQESILDMNNKKNLYLLAIAVANAIKVKYYKKDIPTLSDHLQTLNTSRMRALQKIWRAYINLEQGMLTEVRQYLDVMALSVEAMDSKVDAEVFIRIHRKPESPEISHTFGFIPWSGPGGAGGDLNPNLVDNELALVFLNNKLVKNQRQLDDIITEVEKARKEKDGLYNLMDAYGKNENLGDVDVVMENYMEAHRNWTSALTLQTKYETENELITDTCGEISPETHPHEFKPASFTIPTTCDYCMSTIWGPLKQGFTCRDCGYNCHARCEMKVPMMCTRIKGRIVRPTSAGASEHTATVSMVSPENTSSAPSVSSQEDFVGVPAIALYDYSANGDEDISMVEGESVVVIEGDDGTGWVKIRTAVGEGLVPGTYLTTELLDPEPVGTNEVVADDMGAPSEYVRASYDFDATNEDELSIREGDMILITSKNAGTGWWEGIVNGRKGIFPANYVSTV